MRKLLFYFVTFGLLESFVLIPKTGFSQSSYVPVMDKEYYHLVDRISIKFPQNTNYFHTSVKPIERKSLALLADTLLNDTSLQISKSDEFNLEYLENDNSEWSKLHTNKSNKPFLKYFYKNKSDLFQVNTEDLNLHINPVLYLSYGKESESKTTSYISSRGLELRGMINKKVGFYTFIAENQARFPNYVSQYGYIPNVPIVPGEGYTKSFKTSAVDFITARGYITFNIIKNIQLQFGHDKNFIGNGYRSLILSDFSSNYTFLKLNTHVWKFNYVNIFAEMNADVFYKNILYPKKYFALHHLSLDLTKNINIGIFESLVFGRTDPSKNGQFDFNYLNPVIFYRSIEQQLGSEDNAMLGADLKINFLKHFSFYSQLVLDEFVLKEVKSGNRWWKNQQAVQLGLKYIDVAGISNLDLQVETNIVRPFTYSHKDTYRSYTHFNQPLAHPMGANFKEYIGIVRYQPFKKLRAVVKGIYTKYGSDTSLTSGAIDNFGQNIFKSYNGIEGYRNYGNKNGQGVATNILYLSFNLSYQIKHNLFIDFTQILRTKESNLKQFNLNTNFTSIALRLNISQKHHEF